MFRALLSSPAHVAALREGGDDELAALAAGFVRATDGEKDPRCLLALLAVAQLLAVLDGRGEPHREREREEHVLDRVRLGAEKIERARRDGRVQLRHTRLQCQNKVNKR